MSSITGEICDGISYIEWKRLMSSHPLSEGPLIQCIGRHRLFKLVSPEFDQIFTNPQSEDSAQVTAKYIRSLGSTAIFVSQPDAHGRQAARAQTLGPWERKAVEVGPLEESLVELLERTNKEGYEKTLIEPAEVLGRRSWQIAARSADIFRSAVVPVTDFISKMRQRVPELVKESYNIATSIKIEVKFEDIDDTDDKPQP